MRIVIIMSEASLWKPKYVDGVIRKLPDNYQIVGAVLTNFKPKKTSFIKHLRRYFTMLGVYAFVLMAFREIYHAFLDYIDRFIQLPHPHSIAAVCRRYNIPHIQSKNVNSDETLEWVATHNADILLSSGNQIFAKKLLKIPRLASINRHTSLLPSYGGIYPIFWCLLNDEKEVGVTVHTMTEKIDEGINLAQQSFLIESDDTFFSLFEKCFELSEDVTIAAIKKVANNDITTISSQYEKSYYSYPSKDDIKRFTAKGKRML